ncbi:hypothetical protein BD560DRAFT_404837 [Blakeslea trispora]|nr:hypothetical protein BD560DRAFT_404837 [Blakeslea trispora]
MFSSCNLHELYSIFLCLKINRLFISFLFLKPYTTMTDPTFEALASIPGHLSSFVASTRDGQLLQSTNTTADSEKVASAAYQMLNDALLLTRNTTGFQQDKLENITVTFPNEYHTFTISNDLIYGIERANNTLNQ